MADGEQPGDMKGDDCSPGKTASSNLDYRSHCHIHSLCSSWRLPKPQIRRGDKLLVNPLRTRLPCYADNSKVAKGKKKSDKALIAKATELPRHSSYRPNKNNTPSILATSRLLSPQREQNITQSFLNKTTQTQIAPRTRRPQLASGM
jgi:hypothetical protein